MLIGKKVCSNINVEYEAYVNLKIIIDEYEKLYDECKNRLLLMGCSFDLKKL